MDIKIPLFAGLLGLTASGCQSGKSSDTLALAGYRSLEISGVTISAPTPYDKERFAGELKQTVKLTLDQGLVWSRRHPPRARVEIEIIDFDQPSRTGRIIVGLPNKIRFRVSASDAETGTPLGVATGRTKVNLMLSSILTQGVSGPFLNLQVERAMPNAVWELVTTAQVATDIVKKLDRAKTREGQAAPVQATVAARPARPD